MEKEENRNTEQAILKAAEEVFLEKGFVGAKTTEIASRAGINHAMLHYYFRTKENLFNIVFQRKIELLATSLSKVFSQEVPFFDKIRIAVETHFDFVAANPRLLFFIYSEVINAPERRKQLKERVFPIAFGILSRLGIEMKEEAAKGTIRPIEPLELILNIISLNVITFLAHPLISELNLDQDVIRRILKLRKESNAAFIINGLKA
ncbi:TetR/AcrR family transcriptional regulator [Parabacteroides sp. Marseille-P3160]|uniref:TetR/AcrR family transcriptional regulator n=1 Tax=Parabacteroides sp. Marseille-P3160 TaxID=1917887 RepID=UPI0009B93893|nr:TetR/AcrR family transcriptional regulator [Parabacteroides sp. Marseille-P3160]